MENRYFLLALESAINIYLKSWWWAPALAGCSFILALNALLQERLFQAKLLAIGLLPGAFVAAFVYVMPSVSIDVLHHPIDFPAQHRRLLIASLLVGFLMAFLWLRYAVQGLDSLLDKMSAKTALERDKKTDIRYVRKLLPESTKAFNPLDYIRLKKGIFIGLNEKRKPLYCPPALLDESHILLCGRTRSGKGVAAQILGVQSIQRKELFVVLDPKMDAWMPHVFQAAAVQADQPYVLLDLRQSAPPQINPFAEANVEEIENLLLAAFSLGERGDAADFYRVGDRRAALECARMVVKLRDELGRHPTAGEIMATDVATKWKDNAANFWGYMCEMAELPSVNAIDGISLNDLAQTGGCLYILGDMQNSRVVRMQRLYMLRLMQIAKKRSTSVAVEPKTIRVFADEFTVHISRPFLVSLAASAGWRLCIILAFQTLGDLADCPSDLNAESVKSKVWENCALKLIYAVRDSDTALWLAKSSGVIQVDDETRSVDRNLALSEHMAADRSLRQTESFLVDVNMLLTMPKGCGVLFGAANLPLYCYTSPVNVQRSATALTPTHIDTSSAKLQGQHLAESWVQLDS